MAKGATQRDFEALVEYSPVALVITDQGGRIVLVNRETERMFGYGRTELLGQTVEVLVPERVRRGHVRHRDGYLASPAVRSLGASHCLLGRRKDGTEFPTEIGLSYVETGDGILVMSAIADMTERKEAEEKLRRLATVVADSNDAITVQNPDGMIAAWNRGAEQMYGYSEAEALGQNVRDFVPENRRLEAEALVGALGGGQPVESLETQRVTKDGRVLDVWLTVTALVDASGNPIAIATTERDITDRKRAEEKLSEREEWLSTTLSSIGDAVITTDIAGRVTFLNPAAQSLTGWSQEEAVSRPLAEVFKLISEDTGRPLDDPVTKVMKAGVVVGVANHTALVARDGSTRSIEDSGAPIRDQDGNVIGVVLVFHDVSERRWAAG